MIGRPFTLEHFRAWCRDLVLDNGERLVLEPYQSDFIDDLFAGRPENWLILPEENGKTTLVAALALYHGEHRLDAFVPVAAASRDQAETLYRQAEGFVIRTPKLRRIWDYQPGYRRIRLKKRRHVRIQIFAADAETADSLIPTLAIIDELHRHKNMSLYKTWTGKLRKRRGQVVTISTAGVPGSEFEQARQRIRESAPKITRRTCFTRAAGPQCVLHDWSVPDKGDVEDLRVVKNANPASWITVASLRAKRESPTMTLSHWTRFTCNRATRSEDAAITEQEWGSATVGERIPVGQSIDLGLDVAWKWDTTAMVPLWDRSPKFRLLGPATILVPPRDGNSLHPQKIKDAIESIHERNPIRRIVMDITHAHDIAAWARDELQVEVIEHSQGDVQQAIDYDRFMEALRGGTLHHSADPGLTSHVMNAIARELPNERHRFDRKSSSRDASKQDLRVIDALVASAMVHSEAGAPVKQASDLPPERADGPRPSIAGIREKQW